MPLIACGARFSRQQREIGEAQPQDQPERPGRVRADRARGDEGGRLPRPVGGPEQHRQQRVEDHRAGGAVDRVGGAVQHPAEALAEPPDAERPGDRGGEREPDGRAERDADAEQQLDRGEDRVQQHQVMLNQGRVPGDRAGDDGRIAGGGRRQRLAERLGVQQRLVLENAVEQPDGRQAELQRPPRIGPHRGGRRLRAEPAAHRGPAAGGDGNFTHQGSLDTSRPRMPQPTIERRRRRRKLIAGSPRGNHLISPTRRWMRCQKPVWRPRINP